MSLDKLFSKEIDRRDFLKKSGQAALAVSGGLTVDALLSSCATVGFESREDVVNIKWDANPAIPVPTDGCYAGWYADVCGVQFGIYGELFKKRVGAPEEERLISFYEKFYGQGPAVHSFADRAIRGDFFPKSICEGAYNKGVIPLIRYYFTSDFEGVAKGKYDGELRKFAQEATEFGKPFFFVPYPEVNIPASHKHVHAWGGDSGEWFEPAWAHMRKIFDEIGANENAVWGLHLIADVPKDRFKLDPTLIDWVGFTTYNLERELGWRSFRTALADGYWWARHNYQTKPIALWEFGSSKRRQGKWIKQAYQDIKKLPRIKLVVYCEYPVAGQKGDNIMISEKSRPIFKEIISDPYFIGSILKK